MYHTNKATREVKKDRFSTESLPHQEASISLLSISIRGIKSQSHKTNETDHMTTALSNSGNYEPCHIGPAKMDRGHGGEF